MKNTHEDLLKTVAEIKEILDKIKSDGSSFDYERAKVALEFAKSEIMKSLQKEIPRTD